MTPHEKALVAVLLERLKKVDSAPNDPEAETLIRESTADQPDTAYHLVQTVLIQDLSLHVAQNRIVELEQALRPVKMETPTTSFPDGFSGANGPAIPAPASPVQPGDPMLPIVPGRSIGQTGGGGGGFLRAAAMTAAGVVGAAVLVEGIGSILHRDTAGSLADQAPLSGLKETPPGQDYGGGDPS